MALKAGPFTTGVGDGAQDGGDVDDCCSVHSHPCGLNCGSLQQRQEGLNHKKATSTNDQLGYYRI